MGVGNSLLHCPTSFITPKFSKTFNILGPPKVVFSFSKTQAFSTLKEIPSKCLYLVSYCRAAAFPATPSDCNSLTKTLWWSVLSWCGRIGNFVFALSMSMAASKQSLERVPFNVVKTLWDATHCSNCCSFDCIPTSSPVNWPSMLNTALAFAAWRQGPLNEMMILDFLPSLLTSGMDTNKAMCTFNVLYDADFTFSHVIISIKTTDSKGCILGFKTSQVFANEKR